MGYPDGLGAIGYTVVRSSGLSCGHGEMDNSAVRSNWYLDRETCVISGAMVILLICDVFGDLSE